MVKGVVFSTSSAVTYGKIVNAKRIGMSVPAGWYADKNGNPTNNPADTIKGGALLSLGSTTVGSGHKGYCLSSMADILSAVLSGANWEPFATPFAIHVAPAEKEVGKGIGHLFGAFDNEGFPDKTAFKKEIDAWSDTVRSKKPPQEQTKNNTRWLID